MRPPLHTIATFIESREVHGRPASLRDLVQVMRDLAARPTIELLCRMNADFRLGEHHKDAIAKTQSEIASGLLSPRTKAKLIDKFGREHLADRPLFHPQQLLNLVKIAALHCRGKGNPTSDNAVRYQLGEASLMMNDLMMSEPQRAQVKNGSPESQLRALLEQMLAGFELQNPLSIHAATFRSHVMFRRLVREEKVRSRMAKQFAGFDFERAFQNIIGMPLSNWISLLFGATAYYWQYLLPGSQRKFEHVYLNPDKWGIDSQRVELKKFLGTISMTLDQYRSELSSDKDHPGDWRYDTWDLRRRPLIQLFPDRYICTDVHLLSELMHSGVYYSIRDGLPRIQRRNFSAVWGVLFEEYANWCLSSRSLGDTTFWPRPVYAGGIEAFDGAMLKNSIFVPMECKGNFLRRQARYSGSATQYEDDLQKKIVRGCQQLAEKITKLFHRSSKERSELRDVPLQHVTRVLPTLVVQDGLLNGPLVNWSLNAIFRKCLDSGLLRLGVQVDALNVIGIRELEIMTDSVHAGEFDIVGAMQTRCYVDPEMKNNLHNFLLGQPGYAERKSDIVSVALEEAFTETNLLLFQQPPNLAA